MKYKVIYYKVIYLSQNNTRKLERWFVDFNEAVLFQASQGLDRATLWEAIGFDPMNEEGIEWTMKAR